jgi:hypothetical protein
MEQGGNDVESEDLIYFALVQLFYDSDDIDLEIMECIVEFISLSRDSKKRKACMQV